VTAHDIETSIKDLILTQRASTTYETEVRALLMEKEQFQQSAAGAIREAEERIASAEAEYKNQVRLVAKAQARGLPDEPFFDEMARIQQQIAAALADLEQAEEFARSRELAWERLEKVINESRNLAETWDRVGLSERRILLDWWVLDVMIVVEPIPGMRRANHKSAVVTLRSAPDAPRYFAVRRQLESASDNSSRTHSSSSTNSRDVSASPTWDATSGG
jgi:multidrug efflux pump subunit AcrA (membrane-fusion protein)